jgi:hypothetical protein
VSLPWASHRALPHHNAASPVTEMRFLIYPSTILSNCKGSYLYDSFLRTLINMWQGHKQADQDLFFTIILSFSWIASRLLLHNGHTCYSCEFFMWNKSIYFKLVFQGRIQHTVCTGSARTSQEPATSSNMRPSSTCYKTREGQAGCGFVQILW